jgi:hypothetical protein
MSKDFKIPFAFDSAGTLIEIKDAVKGEYYYCSCGAEVKLRGGSVISNHFYHLVNSECSLESFIHKAYKSVFFECKKIKLPYIVNGTNELIFERVELEKKINDYIADAIGYIGNQQYVIEFAKTSFIKETKKKKIEDSNLFCVEIKIDKRVATIDAIKKHLQEDISAKKIIFIPEYDEMKNLREKFIVAYRELQAENERLNLLNIELIAKTNILHLLQNGCRLYFKAQCKNGAFLFKHDIVDSGSIIGFYDGKKIDVKLELSNNIAFDDKLHYLYSDEVVESLLNCFGVK